MKYYPAAVYTERLYKLMKMKAGINEKSYEGTSFISDTDFTYEFLYNILDDKSQLQKVRAIFSLSSLFINVRLSIKAPITIFYATSFQEDYSYRNPAMTMSERFGFDYSDFTNLNKNRNNIGLLNKLINAFGKEVANEIIANSQQKDQINHMLGLNQLHLNYEVDNLKIRRWVNHWDFQNIIKQHLPESREFIKKVSYYINKSLMIDKVNDLVRNGIFLSASVAERVHPNGGEFIVSLYTTAWQAEMADFLPRAHSLFTKLDNIEKLQLLNANRISRSCLKYYDVEKNSNNIKTALNEIETIIREVKSKGLILTPPLSKICVNNDFDRIGADEWEKCANQFMKEDHRYQIYLEGLVKYRTKLLKQLNRKNNPFFIKPLPTKKMERLRSESRLLLETKNKTKVELFRLITQTIQKCGIQNDSNATKDLIYIAKKTLFGAAKILHFEMAYQEMMKEDLRELENNIDVSIINSYLELHKTSYRFKVISNNDFKQ